MRNNFFSDIKDKFKRASEAPEDEEYYDDDEYEDYTQDDDYNQSEYENQSEEKSRVSSYMPENEYDFGYTPTSSRTDAASYSDSHAVTSDSKYSRYGGTNIYKMNNDTVKVSKAKISRVVYFNIDDAEDARNIADCMINKDSVVLVDITKLSNEDAMKVLNFLDGVRYICKSSIETISNIHLIVPESIELTGDFYDQMSQGTFLG